MASCLVSRMLWIACFAIVSYAIPSTGGNDAAPYLKINEELADQEKLTSRGHEAESTAIKNFQEFAGLSVTAGTHTEPPHLMQHVDVVSALRLLVHQNNDPYFCKDATMDTITRIQNGFTYIFKGDLYWKVFDHAIPEGYPKNISDDWDGLPGNLDASFTLNNGKTYFFKGSQYWRFVNKKMDKGYPKKISERFRGIPDDVDAALSWRGDRQIYFFKGTEYWRLDFRSEPPVDSSYPQSISKKWSSLLENGIDATFHLEDNDTYFFKGDQYYHYNGEVSEVVEADPPYPHPTAGGWIKC